VIEVKQLGLPDLDAVVALRRQALDGHPLAFGAATEEDRLASMTASAALLDNPSQSVLLGAYEGTELVGMAGLARATGAKRHHKAIVWGMYVVPSGRRKGVGSLLLARIIERARTWPDIRQLHLSVTEVAVEARRLYDSAGFLEWGREPRSLHWDGRFVDEIHMALSLE
jgi:GNAT superfamily N-acetyltransferase